MSVLLPCFNAQPDIFAVMDGCVVALIAFSSDMLAWRADSLYIQQGRTQGGRLGLTPSLSLIFYDNFITCAIEINCFRTLFAC